MGRGVWIFHRLPLISGTQGSVAISALWHLNKTRMSAGSGQTDARTAKIRATGFTRGFNVESFNVNDLNMNNFNMDYDGSSEGVSTRL